uniref:Uncharacterized protein n=1 Tax=Ditylenchus dipsaci TaxID=166011 RepID=A0A915CP66_9BILA
MGRPATKKPSPVDAGDAAATKNVTKAPAAKTAAKKSGSKRHRSAYNIFVAEVSPAIAATLKEQGKKDKMMTRSWLSSGRLSKTKASTTRWLTRRRSSSSLARSPVYTHLIVPLRSNVVLRLTILLPIL